MKQDLMETRQGNVFPRGANVNGVIPVPFETVVNQRDLAILEEVHDISKRIAIPGEFLE